MSYCAIQYCNNGDEIFKVCNERYCRELTGQRSPVPQMRHFTNSANVRCRTSRLLILISGEMSWLPKYDVTRTAKRFVNTLLSA